MAEYFDVTMMYILGREDITELVTDYVPSLLTNWVFR